jgi:hypothetical protein
MQFKRTPCIFALILSTVFFKLGAQEITNQTELAAYLPETMTTDVLEIYNKEMAAAAYLPAQNLQNIALLNMRSQIAMKDNTSIRTAVYNHSNQTLEIEFKNAKAISKTTYILNGRTLTKATGRIVDSINSPTMKEIKIGDDKGRVVQLESYFHNDTGWQRLSKENISYQEFKGGLLLEIHAMGFEPLVSRDSVWYFFEKGRLTKKSSPFNLYIFSYDEQGRLKDIANTVKDYETGAETVYHTRYTYNPAGLPVLKEIEQKNSNKDLRLTYGANGKLVLKTVIQKGDNEVKEMNSFTYNKAGYVSAIGQTLNGTSTVKAIITCNTQGQITHIQGQQFAASYQLIYRNGMGSVSGSIQGPAEIETTIAITPLNP